MLELHQCFIQRQTHLKELVRGNHGGLEPLQNGCCKFEPHFTVRVALALGLDCIISKYCEFHRH